jgi:hypothetical protein
MLMVFMSRQQSCFASVWQQAIGFVYTLDIYIVVGVLIPKLYDEQYPHLQGPRAKTKR